MSVPVTVTPSTTDGIGVTYALAIPQGAIAVYIGRFRLVPTLDYTFTAGASFFTTTSVLPAGDPVLVDGDTSTAVIPTTATTSGVTTGTTQLGTLRTVIRQRANIENSQFVTNSELNGYINASYYQLYNLIVQKYGDNYYSALDATNKPYQFTTNGTAEMFALPDGSTTYSMPDGTAAPAFFKLLGVDLWISSAQTTPAQWFTLHRFNMGERNRWTLPNAVAPYGYIGLRYRLEGSKLWLRPLPQAGQLIQVRYVPRLTALVQDTDVADLVSGWEEYIVLDCTIKCKVKAEDDVQVEMALLADITRQIEAAAENRDPGEPQTVVDVQSSGYFGGGL